MKRTVAVLVLGAAAAPLLGCKSMKVGAREYFQTKYSCPMDHITLKARSDVRPEDVRVPQWMRDVQPASDEVKKDPVRYAEWKKNKAKEEAHLADLYSDAKVFEVTGCGHTAILACMHPTDGRSTDEGEVDCEEASKAP